MFRDRREMTRGDYNIALAVNNPSIAIIALRNTPSIPFVLHRDRGGVPILDSVGISRPQHHGRDASASLYRILAGRQDMALSRKKSPAFEAPEFAISDLSAV